MQEITQTFGRFTVRIKRGAYTITDDDNDLRVAISGRRSVNNLARELLAAKRAGRDCERLLSRQFRHLVTRRGWKVAFSFVMLGLVVGPIENSISLPAVVIKQPEAVAHREDRSVSRQHPVKRKLPNPTQPTADCWAVASRFCGKKDTQYLQFALY